MNKLKFSIHINADKNKIWQVLWEDSFYRQWTEVFSEGSYMVVSKWDVGNEVQFLGAEKGGIYSLIEKHIPGEIIQFKHLGLVVNGENQVIDEETKKWSGATEMYSVEEESEGCKLLVEIDVMDEHLDFMNSTFPKAFDIIKANCI